jgi:ankyrin repeat protein
MKFLQASLTDILFRLTRRHELAKLKCLLLLAPWLVHAQGPRGMLPLHQAARTGSRRVIDYLLKKGASLNAFDSTGWTPLHHAVEKNNIRVIKLLVIHGADVDAATPGGISPVQLAQRAQENTQLLEALQKATTEQTAVQAAVR